MSPRRIVVIGAGVVGVAVADELTALGETDVTVLDKGPLYATGGSSSHAPGLISRTSPSKMMQQLADYTVEKFGSLDLDGAPCILPVGTLEVARTPERLEELRRRLAFATSWGWRGRIVDAAECARLWPIIDPSGLEGGYATEGEGLAMALRAVEAQARRAIRRGATFIGDREVVGFDLAGRRVAGVRTDVGTVPADVVVCCAGVWGPAVAAHVGLTLPMLALEHQYVVTSQLPELAANAGNEATLPIVRHHDAGLYLRDHGDRVGIGSFNHRRLPVAADELDSHPRREDGLVYAFTPEDFDDAWVLATELMPALERATLERRFNGVFAFTPDGYPLIGQHPELDGFWVAESVWITHSAGVGRVVAEALVEGTPSIDTSPADLSRFADVELASEVYEARCDDSYRDVYAVHHPAEGHTSARDLRFSPFAERHRALGAAWFDEAGGWERPRWFEANTRLVDADAVPDRDVWSSRFWSPIALAEHRAVREHVGLFDITPLTRIEVSGPGAESYLSWMLAGEVRRTPGTVTYTVMLDARGGILSDVTVTRLDDELFLVGANGPRDVGTLKADAPDDVRVEDVTSRTCGLGLWGPAARDVLAPIVDSSLDDASFPYLSTRHIRVGEAPVTAVRISYAGELGWELITETEWAESLWVALWGAGEPHGIVAAGTAALGTLRLEKGYRAWGVDLTPEYTPDEAGVGFTVRGDRTEFHGGRAVEARRKQGPRALLRCLMLEGDQVAMGGEPVLAGCVVVGFVTSAGYGASVGRSLAYAWLMPSIVPGERVTIRYFDRDLGATVADRGPFDPLGTRLRG